MDRERIELKDYQKSACKFLYTKRRAILAYQMGLGKSAIAIRTAQQIHSDKQTLIICPASLKYNWQSEIEKFADNTTTQVIKTGKDTISSSVRWIICSYDVVSKLLIKFNYDTLYSIVCDEAQMLKGRDSLRTQAILGRLCPKVPINWYLSGTPFPNDIIDAQTVFRFCDPVNIPIYERFGEEFTNKVQFKVRNVNITQYKGIRNSTKLKTITDKFMLRGTIAEFLPELPDYRDIIVPIPADTKELKAAIGYSEKFMGRELQIVSGGFDSEELMTARRLLGESKVKASVDFITQILETEEKVVVFGYHTDVIERVYEALNHKGIKTFKITGSTPTSLRQAYVNEFQSDDNGPRVLIGNIKAMGTGFTLTRSKVCVFLEASFVPGEMLQAKARIRRIGQKSFCIYYFLCVQGSFEAGIYKALENKCAASNEFFGENQSVSRS